MKAIFLHGRARAIRFAFCGVIVGVGFMLGMLLFLNIVAVAGRMPLVPSSMGELYIFFQRTLVLAGLFGFVGLLIGFSTAKFKWRIWGWRLMGGLLIAISLLIFVSLFTVMDPTIVGYVMGTFVCLIGAATGGLMIYEARNRAMDNM